MGKESGRTGLDVWIVISRKSPRRIEESSPINDAWHSIGVVFNVLCRGGSIVLLMADCMAIFPFPKSPELVQLFNLLRFELAS